MLAGKSVVLRPPGAKDEQFLYEVRNDFAAQRLLMALPRANSARRVGDWIRGVLKDPQSLFFVVARKRGDAPLGFVQIRNMDFVHGTGDLGIYLAVEARGKGIAAEAMSLLEEHAASTFRLRKILLKVLAGNTPAIAFYRKTGFRLVGVHRKHFYQDREYHDVAVMEKLL